MFLYLLDKQRDNMKTMTFEINKTLSQSGKRVMWYPTVDGKRITTTNFGKKWEAEKLAKLFLEIKNK